MPIARWVPKNPMHWQVPHMEGRLDWLSGKDLIGSLTASPDTMLSRWMRLQGFYSGHHTFEKSRYTIMLFGMANGSPTYAMLSAMMFEDRLGDWGDSVMKLFFNENGIGSDSFQSFFGWLRKPLKVTWTSEWALIQRSASFFNVRLTSSATYWMGKA